jgi:hypothetical protein
VEEEEEEEQQQQHLKIITACGALRLRILKTFSSYTLISGNNGIDIVADLGKIILKVILDQIKKITQKTI